MKLTIGILTITAAVALAGPVELNKAVAPAAPPESYFKASEFDVAVALTGLWTVTPYHDDRYYGVDHAFGGSMDVAYFLTKNIGAGIHFDGYSVKNLQSGFVGDLVPRLTYRYPIGNFAPYGFAGAGIAFNGGNTTLTEPNCTVGCVVRFEKIEHDVKLDAQVGAGVEFRFSKNLGIFTEGTFDKIDRPQSNAWTVKAGVKVAF